MVSLVGNHKERESRTAERLAKREVDPSHFVLRLGSYIVIF